MRLSAGPAGLRALQEGRTVHVLDFLSLHTVLIGACGLRGFKVDFRSESRLQGPDHSWLLDGMCKGR